MLTGYLRLLIKLIKKNNQEINLRFLWFLMNEIFKNNFNVQSKIHSVVLVAKLTILLFDKYTNCV